MAARPERSPLGGAEPRLTNRIAFPATRKGSPIQPYVVIPPTGSDPADEWVGLGVEAHLTAKNYQKAQRYYARALVSDPCHVTATANLASLHALTDHLADAVLGIERAILFADDRLAPGVFGLVLANKAMILFEAGDVAGATATADLAISLTPTPPTTETDPLPTHAWLAARTCRATLCAAHGRPGDGLVLWREILKASPKDLQVGNNACFALSLIDSHPSEILAQRSVWRAAHGYKGWHAPHDNDKNPDRPLRVGYVGGDFKTHSASMIFGQVLLNHDRSVIEPYFYSNLVTDPEKDDITKMLRAAGQWRDIVGLSDEEADSLIRIDKIDILVDLSGHTNGGRLVLFTRRPAPVQVTAWGFVLGTGLPEIDYFFADPVVIPPDERQHYAEKIVDLPCVITFRPPSEYGLKAESDPPCQKRGYITFGCFNRYEKLSDEYLDAVAEILRRVPDSHIWFKDPAYRRPFAIQRAYQHFAGIDKRRIKFFTASSHPEHMLAYQQVDLILDPWPHGAGVCALEALYMGVPFITRYGTQPAGRLGASVLVAMGNSRLATENVDDYIDTAVEFAQDRDALAGARLALRSRLLESPVVKGYREAVEQAYRQIWRTWCEKQ